MKELLDRLRRGMFGLRKLVKTMIFVMMLGDRFLLR